MFRKRLTALLVLGTMAFTLPASASQSGIAEFFENKVKPLIMGAFLNRPDRTELYEFTMANRKFRMPMNYINSGNLPPSGSAIDGLHMVLLWPGLEPQTSENEKEFRRVGWNRKIRMLLQEHTSHLTGQALLDVKLRNSDPDKCREEAVHYQICPGPRNDDIHIIQQDNSLFFFTCSKAGVHPSPSCSKFMLISDGVQLSYSFSKKYVADIQKIEQGLIDLFRRFDVTDH